MVYIIAPTLTKLALLVLYHRINPSHTFRCCIYVAAAAIIIVPLVLCLMVLFDTDCTVLVDNALCVNNVSVAWSVLNIVGDLVLIIMPIPSVLALDMAFRQKLAIITILLIGSG